MKTTASERLLELVSQGIDHGIYSIQDGWGVLIPFIMTEDNWEIESQRFMNDTFEESISEAQRHLIGLSEKVEIAIIVYEGFAKIEQTKYDAIIVEGYEKMDKNGYCFAQCFKPKKILSKFKEIGNLVFLDELENILKS